MVDLKYLSLIKRSSLPWSSPSWRTSSTRPRRRNASTSGFRRNRRRRPVAGIGTWV